jgi:hypothetical protein
MVDAVTPEILQKMQQESVSRLRRLEAEAQAERAFLDGIRQKLGVMGVSSGQTNGQANDPGAAATLSDAIKQDQKLPVLIRRAFEVHGGGPMTASEVAEVLKKAGMPNAQDHVQAITSTMWRLKGKRYRQVSRGVYERIEKKGKP